MKYRYRLHFRLFRQPLLVLQVQDWTIGLIGKEFYWRDATAEDLLPSPVPPDKRVELA